ncbi:MAG: hypothetical protein QM784_12275 [Polyangiaceae bacterium]
MVKRGPTLARRHRFDQLAGALQQLVPRMSLWQAHRERVMSPIMRIGSWVPVLCCLAWVSLARNGRAACAAAGSDLDCFDAVPTSGPAEPSAFRWASEGKVLPPDTTASGLHYGFASRPLELTAPSADPAGRRVPVIGRSHRIEFRAAHGIGRGMDWGLAVPVSLDQTGVGSEGLSSQRPQPVARTGLGDLRLGLRTELPKPHAALNWNLRLELGLPTGDERNYLGERSFTETVALNGALTYRPLLFVSDLGVRFSKASRFADVVLGTQGFLSLGVAYRILPRDLLALSLEGRVRPILVPSQSRVVSTLDGTTTKASWVVPAEWMANIRSRMGALPLWLSAGAGTALDWSKRDTNGADVDDSFIAPTTPRWRIALAAVVLH